MRKRKLAHPRTWWWRFRHWLGFKIAGVDYQRYVRSGYTANLREGFYGRRVWEQLNHQSNMFTMLPKKPWTPTLKDSDDTTKDRDEWIVIKGANEEWKKRLSTDPDNLMRKL